MYFVICWLGIGLCLGPALHHEKVINLTPGVWAWLILAWPFLVLIVALAVLTYRNGTEEK